MNRLWRKLDRRPRMLSTGRVKKSWKPKWQKQENFMRNPSPRTRFVWLLSVNVLIVLLLLLAGCQTTSGVLQPEVPKPVVIPSPPAVRVPLPSGAYWEKHSQSVNEFCDVQQRTQKLLSQTPTPCER